jgi:chaperonin GroEL (HSP60 family)
MTEEPIDLSKAGIWDATRAVVQTIENATSAAGALLTVGALVTPYDETDRNTD